jgi:hypothetical protein
MGGPIGIGRRRSVEGLAIRLGLVVVVTLAAGAASAGLGSASERKVVKAARADAAVQASLRKAVDIVRCQNFARCGGDWRQNVIAVGYGAASGENLYLGEGRLGAPRVALDGWLNSPTHRRNLFDPRWTSQGIAVLVATAVGDYRNAAIWVHVLGAA